MHLGRLFLAFVGVALVSVPINAHHSFTATYQDSREIKVSRIGGLVFVTKKRLATGKYVFQLLLVNVLVVEDSAAKQAVAGIYQAH